jgi:hypothetical protein
VNGGAAPPARGLLALAFVVAAGCGVARSPDGAVRALADAAEAGDRDGVWALLGPATRARLTADAESAAQASGRRDILPRDLLAAGWSAPRWKIRELDVVARAGDRATVEVRGKGGERESLSCVAVGGAWRVELP